jgi:hypothetical protein
MSEIGRHKKGFAACGVLLALGVAGYLLLVAHGRGEGAAVAPAPAPGSPTELSGSLLMARAVDRNDPRRPGELLVLKGGGPHRLSGDELACERVYFAGGRGLCLAAAGDGYEATIFDSDLQSLGRLPLAGLPSRARVSGDGRFGATTVFVDGHAYEKPTGFSTVTTIVDMNSGATLGNLEDFAVSKDGKPFDAVDFNFWGVTFQRANPDHFYATLHTGRHYYLVEGSVFARTMRVLRDGVECPSLSPDGTRIAFKHRIGEDRWRLEVLDLDTLAARRVGERRSIDDQAEWLDDRTLVYSDGLDIYTVAADGSGSPRLVLRNATSPVSLAPQGQSAESKPAASRG